MHGKQPFSQTIVFFNHGYVKQGHRVVCTLAGCRQDTELPVKPFVVQDQAFKITGMALGRGAVHL